MWLQNKLRLFQQSSKLFVRAGDEFGVQRLFEALNTDSRPLIYVELDLHDIDDYVLQGNKFADAVSLALGGSLFGYGLSYSYGIAVLEQYLDLLGPFVFVINHVDHGIQFALELQRLAKDGSLVIVRGQNLLDGFKQHSIVANNDLAMSFEEAQGYVAGRLTTEQTELIWQQSNQAFEVFVQTVNSNLGLTGMRKPYLNKGSANIGELRPELLLDVLIRQHKWIEAFELTVDRMPFRAAEVIKTAGHHYQSKGLYKALKQRIQKLPKQLQQDDCMLRFMLSCAFRTGITNQLTKEIDEVLADKEAFELRAIYSGVPNRNYKHRLEEARVSYSSFKSPITSYYFGTLLAFESPFESVEILKKSVQIAEESGYPYEVARNANALASSLSTIGNFAEAWSWSSWAMRVFNSQGIGDSSRLIKIINEWSYNSILLGKLTGVESKINEILPAIHTLPQNMSELLQTTLGDLYFVTHRIDEALLVYKENYSLSSRKNMGFHAINLVKTLVFKQEYQEALEVANEANNLLQEVSQEYSTYATLAYGMALIAEDAKRAVLCLQKAFDFFEKPLKADLFLMAGAYLVQALIAINDRESARLVMNKIAPMLNGLGKTGKLLLTGKVDFIQEQDLLVVNDGFFPIELEFMGARPITIIRGRQVDYSLKLKELFVLLVYYADGLTSEQLLAYIYGDGGTVSTLKSMISRMRKRVAIIPRPYRLVSDARADFVEFESLLDNNNINAALSLYRGPLLPESNAPKIIELREVLDSKLRSVILQSSDVDVISDYLRFYPDDLEVMEHALEHTPSNDPRFLLFRNMITKIASDWDVTYSRQ